jgi:hypothetical protein
VSEREVLLQIHAAAPDVFSKIRQPWLPGIKNPCYYDATEVLRCLPFLSIIGVSKAGTTDLYKKLMMIRYAE